MKNFSFLSSQHQAAIGRNAKNWKVHPLIEEEIRNYRCHPAMDFRGRLDTVMWHNPWESLVRWWWTTLVMNRAFVSVRSRSFLCLIRSWQASIVNLSWVIEKKVTQCIILLCRLHLLKSISAATTVRIISHFTLVWRAKSTFALFFISHFNYFIHFSKI